MGFAGNAWALRVAGTGWEPCSARAGPVPRRHGGLASVEGPGTMKKRGSSLEDVLLAVINIWEDLQERSGP